MMYYQTNLGYKSFSISEDIVTMIVALTLKIAKQISVWYSGSWWCITILSLFDQGYCRSLQFLTFTVTLAEQPFHKTLQLMNMHWFGRKKIGSSEHMNTNSVTVSLTLKIATHFLHMPLWRIMMYQHTGFSYKRFSDSADIIQTNINWDV